MLLSITEFKKYCNDKKISRFVFDSLNQTDNGYISTSVKMKQLQMFAMPSDGILIFNDTNKDNVITFHKVKNIKVRSTRQYYGVTFDIFCGATGKCKHTVVGRF